VTAAKNIYAVFTGLFKSIITKEKKKKKTHTAGHGLLLLNQP
jgi:hypothetical protein